MNQGLWPSRLPSGSCSRSPDPARSPHPRRRIDQTDCLREFEVESGTLAGKTKVDCVDGAACDADRVQRILGSPSAATDRHQRLHARAAHLHRTPTGGVARAALLLRSACEPSTGVAVSLRRAARGGRGEDQGRSRPRRAQSGKTDKDRLTLRCLPTPTRAVAVLSAGVPANPSGGLPMRSTWWSRPKGRISTSEDWRLSQPQIFPWPRARAQGLRHDVWSGRRFSL